MITITAVQAPAAPSSRTSARASRKGVRLEITRRGRIVRALVLVLLAAAVLFAALTEVGATGALADLARGPETVSVTVQPGDTLWEYGQTYASEGADLRDWVLDVQRANGLPSVELTAGTQIEVPVGA